MSEIFTDSFINRVKETLDEHLPVGSCKCITRGNLVRLLGVDPKFRLDSAIGALISSEEISGFEVRKGPHGGIGRVGERPERKAKTGSKSLEITEEFKGKLMTALETLCDSQGNAVPRQDIAAYMNDSKSVSLISAALKLDEFSDFETKVGKSGGVRRIPTSVGDDLTSDLENLSSEEVIAEAAV